MTIFQLQRDLAEEIEQILASMRFKNPQREIVPMRTYCQDIPKRRQEIRKGAIMPEEEEADDPYPFCIVKAESGGIFCGGQAVSIMLIIAVFNDDERNQGQQELLNIIHRIAERFIRNPVLKDKHMLDQEDGIKWILDDEDRYPYFVGGMTMKWETFFAEKEDDYV